MSKFKDSFKTGVLLLACCLAFDSLAHGQWVGRGHGRGQGRREGGIVLPTPPFNPDAGILRSRKGRDRTPTKTAPRRAATRPAVAGGRNPRVASAFALRVVVASAPSRPATRKSRRTSAAHRVPAVSARKSASV